MATTPKVLCAIYTRKSTEEGLDQNFNSLDAQHDACANYIASQKSEGWVTLKDRYDDGGFSGGTLERPAIKRLLEDVRKGLVNTIVVYKIDRLSRSLADFAKLVELFDQHKVTFVSVTQSFNTTTSMGRLTLNILLSFAQFERELSGERVRDKIAASRKRGIWMGGMPALGYDVVERKLVPNPKEAAIVQEIFARFAATPSMATIVKDLRKRGVTSKSWTTAKGVVREGKLITKGLVYKIFSNPVYIGIAAYKGQHFPGEHDGIITQELWDTVQTHLKNGAPMNKARLAGRGSAPSLLRGLIFSEQGRAFTPGWTRKQHKTYRYYINTDSIKIGKESCDICRIPAGEIEQVVVEKMRGILRSPEVLAHAVREVNTQRPRVEETNAISALQSIDAVWDELFPAEQAKVLHTLVDRITVRKDGIAIKWHDKGLNKLLRDTLEPQKELEAA
jgi:DNA invertase Pin-like site-specific DNA recombinase